MKSAFKISVLFLLFSVLASCSTGGDNHCCKKEDAVTLSKRVAAEWEPAIGVIVAWPLDLPHQLIVALANDTKLYTIVPDEKEINTAKKWYTKWNIDLDKCEFIISEQGLDSWWARDWGAFALFNENGEMCLADGQYKYSTPVSTMGCNDSLEFLFSEKDPVTGKTEIILTVEDDDTPKDIAKYMNYPRIDLPFTFTGGNVFMDGHGTALSSCIIKNENRYIGNSDEQFINYANEYLGINKYNFISNFEESGIQHIDCYLKMLDNNRLLVMQPPVDHPLYAIYENIAENELPNLRNAAGEPYEILRLHTNTYKDDRLAAYSNSLILNKNIYVPMFGIPQDSIALQEWSNAMPGYTVKGFEYQVFEEPILHPRVLQRRKDGFGWKDGDALHCRTRAMWDPNMLYIGIAKQPNKDNEGIHFSATIIDYAKKGLNSAALLLMWREKGETTWHNTPLKSSGENTIYEAFIALTDNPLEYYFTASNGEKEATLPMTAPKGFYTLK